MVFLSHCLLNQNTRYLGGAWCAGADRSVVDRYVGAGVGLCQMPCPEQACWGGVLKRTIVACYGWRSRWFRRGLGLLLPLFLLYTRWRYRRLAAQVVRQMADYQRSGFDIVGMVGVAGSPSCGLRHTLDLGCCLSAVGSLDVATVDRALFNARAIAACQVAGSGMFMQALQRQIARRGLAVACLEHDPAGARAAQEDPV